MELNEKDLDFLEKVGKQLRPTFPKLDKAEIMAMADKVKPIFDELAEETAQMTVATLLANCPILYALTLTNPAIAIELVRFRDCLVLHAMTRMWQFRSDNDLG